MVLKVTLVLGVVLALFVAESSCQKFIQPTFRPRVPNNRPRLILPTYRPPPSKPILRLAREAGEFAPPTEEDVTVSPLVYVHLNRTARSLDSPGAKRGGGSHSTSSGSRNTGATHPGYNRRNARSVDSPSARRGGGSPRTSSSSRNTGPTHPGYNRRNARDIRLPGDHNPFKPRYPRPTVPAPVFPILARTARDIQIPGMKKPTHRDVIIPNWNPNVRTNPWNKIGGRHRRSLDVIEAELGPGSHERKTRDVHVSGLPELKKPTYRDVVIPNWNPHVRTNPLGGLGGARRH